MQKLDKNQESLIGRRGFLLGTLAVAVSAAASNAVASSGAKHDHAHHHHHVSKNTDLISAASDCVTKGQLCRDHCIELVKAGDSSIADCLDAVIDTIAMCETLGHLAVSDSKHLKPFAKVCIQVCKDCEEECRAHKDDHKECKACMESCAHCIKELEKLVA